MRLEAIFLNEPKNLYLGLLLKSSVQPIQSSLAYIVPCMKFAYLVPCIL